MRGWAHASKTRGLHFRTLQFCRSWEVILQVALGFERPHHFGDALFE